MCFAAVLLMKRQPGRPFTLAVKGSHTNQLVLLHRWRRLYTCHDQRIKIEQVKTVMR